MYYVRTEAEFDSTHFLKDYVGKCGNIHGHRWRVVIEVKSEKLKEDKQCKGMVIDFADLKEVLNKLCDEFDHVFIYETGSLKDTTIKALQDEGFVIKEVDFRATAECFAKYFYDEMTKAGFDINRVEVYETPNNCAIYEQ